MHESRVAFLRRMIATPSPSGFEQAVQQVIREEVSQYSDEVRTDVHGNVIASLNATAQPRVMITAHCDELGFLIRYIDEQGFLYFATIGGFDPSTLPGNRVKISTPNGPILGVIGRNAVHTLSPEDRGKAPRLADLWIDIGAASKEEAQRRVPLGSVATRANELEQLNGDIVVSRALDDKSGVLTVVEAFRRIHERRSQLQAGVFFVSAVQEEVGLRGAQTSAYGIDPQVAIAVDVTFATDNPGMSKQEYGDIKINGGPVITTGGNINPRIFQLLVKVAEEANINWQIEPIPGRIGADIDAIQVTRSGVATGLISIPSRYMHSSSEVVSLQDIDDAAELIARFVLALDADTNIIP